MKASWTGSAWKWISGTPAADTTYHGCTLEAITVDAGIGAGAIMMLQALGLYKYDNTAGAYAGDYIYMNVCEAERSFSCGGNWGNGARAGVFCAYPAELRLHGAAKQAASELRAMRYYRDVLRPLVESGRVVEYELQKPYELQPKFIRDGRTVHAITYVADFYMVFDDGSVKLVDVKGCPDSTAILKRKLFWYRYPHVDYEWVGFVKKFGGWLPYEQIKKMRAVEKAAKQKESKEDISDVYQG